MFFLGAIGIVLFCLWIYCIFDVISTDEALVRNMPKILWLLIVIILPTIGSVAWLALGRPERAGFQRGSIVYRSSSRPIGPEDSPEFMVRTGDEAKRLRSWEEDLRRREEDLRRREDGGPN